MNNTTAKFLAGVFFVSASATSFWVGITGSLQTYLIGVPLIAALLTEATKSIRSISHGN